jgi:cellobiose phosphorylase
MYRLLVESLLGLRIEADRFTVSPRLPADWAGFSLEVRLGGGSWNVNVRRSDRPGVSVDGVDLPDGAVPLGEGAHTVEVRV